MSTNITDEQVIAAIEERKLQWTRHKLNFRNQTTEDMWMFNHVHTVLNHATKIFKTPIDSLNKETFKDKTNA